MRKELFVLGALMAASLLGGWMIRQSRPARQPVPQILPAEVDLATFRKVVSEKSAIILDARGAEFFEKVHVPGARNLPSFELSASGASHPALASVAKDRQIVVYCSGLHCPDSTNVANGLALLGYTHVTVFKGGIKAWKDAGYTTESAP